MDFQVLIGDEFPEAECFVFATFDNALDFIKQNMAQWNNFYGNEVFRVSIIKVPSETETFGVSTGETVETSDVFGGLPDKPDNMSQEEWDARVKAYLRDKRQREDNSK